MSAHRFERDPAVVTWQIAMAPRPRYVPPVDGHWWRDLVTSVFRDTRDAWEALRESEVGYQLEDEDFRELYPAPTLRGVLEGLSTGRMAPERLW